MFRTIKSKLRQIESKNNTVHINFKEVRRSGVTSWIIKMDKLVLYKNKTRDDIYVYEANSPLDCKLHENVLQNILAGNLPAQSHPEVSVTPSYKKFLRIPIKIPFVDRGWEETPKKVRGDDSLGTMPVRIRIKLMPNENITAENLWNILNTIATVHTNNFYYDLDNNKTVGALVQATERASKNPLAKHPYGHTQGTVELDMPIINSGPIATATNTIIIGLPIAAVFCLWVFSLFNECKEGEKSNKSSTGFMFGLLMSNNNSPTTDMFLGSILTDTSSTGTFQNGMGQALLFNSTLVTGTQMISGALTASTSGDDCCSNTHAPFATRTVLRPR